MKESDDGCADIICSMHGFLARTLRYFSEVHCNTCGKWLRTESQEMLDLRENNREKKREQREQTRRAA